MLWHAALHDDAVLAVALQAEAALALVLTGAALCEPPLQPFTKETMKIAIVGAGIIGVTTAWELAADGHEVMVFERRGAAAEESSFANAGVVAPGYVTPWAGPGMRAKVLRSLLSTARRHQAALAAVGCATCRWMSRWQRACRLETYLANRARMQRLAFYSRTRLHEITRSARTGYERSDGYLVLLRSQARAQAGAAGPGSAARSRQPYSEKSMPTRRGNIEPGAQHRHRAGRRHPPAATTRSATAGSSRCCSSGKPRRWAPSSISTATSRR